MKKVLHSLDVFVGCENDLRFALNPRILLEAIALRAAASSGEVNLDDLQSRVNRLEKRWKSYSNRHPFPPIRNVTTDLSLCLRRLVSLNPPW